MVWEEVRIREFLQFFAMSFCILLSSCLQSKVLLSDTIRFAAQRSLHLHLKATHILNPNVLQPLNVLLSLFVILSLNVILSGAKDLLKRLRQG